MTIAVDWDVTNQNQTKRKSGFLAKRPIKALSSKFTTMLDPIQPAQVQRVTRILKFPMLLVYM